ncbi:MAG: DsrE family protein [Mycobacterium sp.]
MPNWPGLPDDRRLPPYERTRPAQADGKENAIDTDDAPGLVIHVSSGAEVDWTTALRYAVNFTAAIEGTRQVDVVLTGAALDLVLAESTLRAHITDLNAAGSVAFSACANTMAARGIGPADLHPAARIVPAAVLHLAQRQWAGWAYLRP